MRGIAALEARVKGPAVRSPLGVYGGAVMNPATAAARLVASLHDDEGRVLISGFYDAVQPLAEWEREAAKNCPVTDADLLAQTGSPALFGEPGYNALERIGARPTAEVNGIGGGYQGEGTKTVLPASAFFKLTFRLVPSQEPSKILDLAEAHLRTHLPARRHARDRARPQRRTLFQRPNLARRTRRPARARARLRRAAEPPPRRRQHPDPHDLQANPRRGRLSPRTRLARLRRPLAERKLPRPQLRSRHRARATLLEEFATVPRNGIQGYKGDVPDLSTTSRTA